MAIYPAEHPVAISGGPPGSAVRLIVGALLAGLAGGAVAALLFAVEMFRHGIDLDFGDLGWLLLVALFGALAGLLPAAACLLIMAIAGPLLREAPAAVRRWGTIGLATLVTGAFASWPAQGLGPWVGTAFVVTTAALAALGAVLSRRWALVDRHP